MPLVHPSWGRQIPPHQTVTISICYNRGQSANPAFSPGLRGSQRVFTREWLAPSEKGIRAVKPAIPCWCAASGHCAYCSKYTRGQSLENGTLSRFSCRMEASTKHISLDSVNDRERLYHSVQVLPTSNQWCSAHSGGPQAGSFRLRFAFGGKAIQGEFFLSA